jgi:hypothetical protein
MAYWMPMNVIVPPPPGPLKLDPICQLEADTFLARVHAGAWFLKRHAGVV